MMWSEKYRPQNISEMIGNEDARSSLVEYMAKWKKGVKPILLVGPPGIGKTTIANLIAKQFDYDLVGLNASDVRSKSRINELLTPVMGNDSIFGKQMVFVDEVDGIHGRSDFGGAEALINILKEPTIPFILAANSENSDKMKKIKKVVKVIHLKPLPPRLLCLYLMNILTNEDAEISPGALIKLISESKGDIRSMINSAQALVTGFNPPTEQSFEKMDVEIGIDAFFKAKSVEEARSILYSLRIDPREKINAFYSSIVTSPISKEEFARVLPIISEADMLYGKIMKTQQWRLLRYLDAILIKLYKKDLPVRYSKYNLSWDVLNRLRWDGAKIKAFSKIFSQNLHISKSTFATFYFPYILFCMKNKTLELDLEDTHYEMLEKEMELLK